MRLCPLSSAPDGLIAPNGHYMAGTKSLRSGAEPVHWKSGGILALLLVLCEGTRAPQTPCEMESVSTNPDHCSGSSEGSIQSNRNRGVVSSIAARRLEGGTCIVWSLHRYRIFCFFSFLLLLVFSCPPPVISPALLLHFICVGIAGK